MSLVKTTLVISALAFILTSCAHKTEYNFYNEPPGTSNIIPAPIATAYYPYQVEVYDSPEAVNKPFVPLGEVTVTKVNSCGLLRQKARIKTILREEATMMGGDAVIFLPSDDKKVCRAEVVEFQHSEADTHLAKQQAKDPKSESTPEN